MILITSVMRSASPGLAFQVAATTNAISAVLPGGGDADGVAQDADRAGLHLDDVAGAEPTVQLQPGAAGGGAGAQHVTGAQGLVLGRVGDEVTEAVVHVGGGVAAPAFAVDAHLQLEVARSISSVVTMQGPRTLDPSHSFALAGPMPTGSSRRWTSRADRSFQMVKPNT